MQQYEDKIEKALLYLKTPSKLSPTGYSPIVYMVYDPEDAFVVRSLIDSFIQPKATYHQFTTHVVSMGAILDKFINSHEYLSFWASSSVKEAQLYTSIKQEVETSECIEQALLDLQEKFVSEQQPLMIIKDLEMLHPFNMIGVIENKIYNRIRVPMLVLYPGETQGTARSFMGIYNQDGNYRSINF